MITGETIKSSISQAIRNGFSVTEGVPPVVVYPVIYKEKMDQNSTKPCFFIWTNDVSVDKLMNDNYELTYQMNIRYFVEEDSENAYEKMCYTGLKLTEVLRYIYTKMIINNTEQMKRLTGTQIEFKIVENVLQFFVTYKIKAYIPLEEVTKMEQLIINN